MLKSLLYRLTDNYKKDPSSNIGKLLNVVAGELEEVKGTLEKIEEWRDIDTAEGVALDKIGINVQQFRGVANDEIYRILIKSKIASNLSKGDINTIIRVLALSLDTAVENIKTRELYKEGEPAAVFIDIPTNLLNRIGFSINQFGRLANRIVAGGVRANVLFQGTFSFSSQYDVSEFDIEKGFADLGQTTGGKLGAVYDPGNDIDLPI